MSQELQRKLQEARKKLGMSQAKFAAHLGMSARTLQSWEANRFTPQGFALAAINELLEKILAEK
jgi:DNA-binding transcriptional regulator YiaG